jgi:hypothetical protein
VKDTEALERLAAWWQVFRFRNLNLEGLAAQDQQRNLKT